MGQVRWPSGAGDEMSGMGAAGQREMLVEPSFWLQLDKLDIVSSPRSCSLLSSLVGHRCHVSPARADTGRAVAVRGRMKLLQCRERQCRLISATAFYTMIHSGWPITIIPDRFTNTTTLSAPSVLEIRVISLHRLRNYKKKRFEN